MTMRFPNGVWAVVLIVSVLVNGVVLGVAAAGAVSGLRLARDEAPGIGQPLSVGMLAAGLPEEARGQLQRRLRDQARQSRDLFLEAQRADRAVMEALTAEEFDPEAARAAFARTRGARDALEARAHDMLITLFSDLTYEARVGLIERTRERDLRMRGDGRFGPDGRFGNGGPGAPGGRFPDGPPGPPPGD